jgi:hypothetical protein
MIARSALGLLALLSALPALAQAPRPGAPAAVPAPEAAANPTEALFNAINLGDLDQVRAAVGAGAATDARNVLGLTPLDLAIDLGHADIAFYLMSLGRVSSRPSAPAPAVSAPPSRAVQPRSPVTARPPAPAPAPTGAVPVAPLWQGGGGSPVPEAGFLGFDAGRPDGARPPARPRG